MPPPTYRVSIDFNDNTTYAEAGENRAADVIHMEWRLGMAAPYDSLAAPATARITLRNPTRAYSPEYTADDLQPGKVVCIQSDDGLTIRTHFTGFIDRVEPQTGDHGERLSVIYAVGAEAVLGQQRIRLPPQVNATADTVIAAVLDACLLRYTPLASHWLFDVPNHAELGINTYIAGAVPRALESGRSTFAYTADTWDMGIPAATAVRQMAESERGRFYTDRYGQFIFLNRHHTLLTNTSLAAFSDDMDGLEYNYGGEVANQVEVTLLPRSIGTPATVLWRLDNPQLIHPGETGTRRVVAPFRDTVGRPVGALSLVTPTANIDFQGNALANGTGANRTALLNVVVMELTASAAVLEIRNTGSLPVYLLAGAQLRGTPLLTGDPALVVQSDYASINTYGLRALSLNTPSLSTIEEAAELAGYELARRHTPRGILTSISLSSTAHLDQILDRSLFDRITVHDTQTNHTADYFIIAEEHTVDLGGTRHRNRWRLEPAAANAFWILDTSKLDQTAVLAY
ncbi:MAG: hypothetical protein LCI00_28085 [Chloroflexi bacterium]|nr:hypothetical protein [Chloroflexota bacterium]MCC6896811.1 hypothetical protein [Anaerolineae bacterium]